MTTPTNEYKWGNLRYWLGDVHYAKTSETPPTEAGQRIANMVKSGIPNGTIPVILSNSSGKSCFDDLTFEISNKNSTTWKLLTPK